MKFKRTRSKPKNIKLDLPLLKSNKTHRDKYRVTIQNKSEVLREAKEVD